MFSPALISHVGDVNPVFNNVTNSAVLTPEPISPDKVIEQTIIARQRELWDQFFLYME